MDTQDAKYCGYFYVDLNIIYHYYENDDHVANIVYIAGYEVTFD